MDVNVLRKLRYKQGQLVLVLNSKGQDVDFVFEALAVDLEPRQAAYDFILLFVRNSVDLIEFAPLAFNLAHLDSIIWVAYPKKSSGMPSDLDRDEGWECVKNVGYRPVSQCAINQIWSALRFKQGVWPDLSPKQDRPELKVPQALQTAFALYPDAEAKFSRLAYTHRKEYIKAIVEAKKQETRERRVEKTIESLLSSKK